MNKIWSLHNNKWVKDTYSGQDEYCLRNDDDEDQADNMIQLRHLNEPSILNGVSLRYHKNKIYTFTGEILLSINPCQDLDLYTPQLADKYRNHELSSPHIYWIAQHWEHPYKLFLMSMLWIVVNVIKSMVNNVSVTVARKRA